MLCVVFLVGWRRKSRQPTAEEQQLKSLRKPKHQLVATLTSSQQVDRNVLSLPPTYRPTQKIYKAAIALYRSSRERVNKQQRTIYPPAIFTLFPVSKEVYIISGKSILQYIVYPCSFIIIAECKTIDIAGSLVRNFRQCISSTEICEQKQLRVFLLLVNHPLTF